MTTRGGTTIAAEEQLHAIGKITELIRGQLETDEILSELLDRVVELVGADTAAILLLDEAEEQLVASAARGIESEVRQGVRVALGAGFAGRVASEMRPVAIHTVDESTVSNPILWERGIKAMLGVPLVYASDVIGVLHVGTLSERRFSSADADLLELAASQIATAIRQRQLEEERSAARVLQRSLLPSALPQCEGFEFATRFVPAEHGGVGGDWYDAFSLDSGALWIMTGDVMGHGLRAAVVMGRLRSTLRSYALEGHSPEKVLALADRKLQHFEPGETATILCASLDPPYDTVRLALAGHLPPVLAEPDGKVSLVEAPIAPPLGVMGELEVTSAQFAFPRGGVLVAYTDGLVERRGEVIDEGLARLRDAVSVGAPEVVCREVMDALVADQIPGDDIALLVLRRLEA